MTTAEDLTSLAAVVIDAVNRHDLDLLAQLLDPGYRAEWPDGELDATAAFEREIAMMTGIPDTRFGLDRATMLADGRVLVEATVTGTHTGELDLPFGVSVAPTGRSVRLPFLFVMTFSEGRLLHERLFFDHLVLLAQLDQVTSIATA